MSRAAQEVARQVREMSTSAAKTVKRRPPVSNGPTDDRTPAVEPVEPVTAQDGVADIAPVTAPPSQQEQEMPTKKKTQKKAVTRTTGLKKKKTAATSPKAPLSFKGIPPIADLRLANKGVRSDGLSKLVFEFTNGYSVTLQPVDCDDAAATRDLVVSWARKRLGGERSTR